MYKNHKNQNIVRHSKCKHSQGIFSKLFSRSKTHFSIYHFCHSSVVVYQVVWYDRVWLRTDPMPVLSLTYDRTSFVLYLWSDQFLSITYDLTCFVLYLWPDQFLSITYDLTSFVPYLWQDQGVVLQVRQICSGLKIVLLEFYCSEDEINSILT